MRKTISLCPHVFNPEQTQRSLRAHTGVETVHRCHTFWSFNRAVDLININLNKPTLADLKECKGAGLKDKLTMPLRGIICLTAVSRVLRWVAERKEAMF